MRKDEEFEIILFMENNKYIKIIQVYIFNIIKIFERIFERIISDLILLNFIIF